MTKSREEILKDLKEYQEIKGKIRNLKMEIQSLSYPLSSAPMVGDGSFSSMPGNPTEKTALKLAEKRDELNDMKDRLIDLSEEIWQWLEGLDDVKVASMIRLHYLRGLTWKATGKTLGYSKTSCIRIVKEFFRGQDI